MEIGAVVDLGCGTARLRFFKGDGVASRQSQLHFLTFFFFYFSATKWFEWNNILCHCCRLLGAIGRPAAFCHLDYYFQTGVGPRNHEQMKNKELSLSTYLCWYK